MAKKIKLETHLSDANNFVSQGKYNAAFKEYEKAIAKGNNSAELYKSYGAALTTFGIYSKVSNAN